MIILDQYHRLVRVRDFLDHRCCKFAVYFLIELPIERAKDWPSVGDVAQRPQTLIGKAIVVSFLLFLAQPHAPKGIARIIGRNPQPIVRVHHFGVGVSAAVRDPCAVASIKHRLQSSDQAACRNHHFERFSLPPVNIRLAVGYDDQFPTVKAGLDLNRQPIRRPHRFSGFPQSGLILRCAAGLRETFCKGDHFPCQRFEQIQVRHLLSG